MAMQQALDTLLKGATEAGDVPGVVAMVTNRDETIYEGAFGVRKAGEKQAMTQDTVGLIASMTKAITSVAAMQLVEQGKLDLESPASKWAPELGKVQVLDGFDAAGKPKLRAPKHAMTLKHLLTHTAGFGYSFTSADIKKYEEVTGEPGPFTCTRASLNAPLLFDPGERWEYGINIDWAGQLVERVSGMRLGEYFTKHILGPLGMNDTAFVLRPDMMARRAHIHARLPDGTATPIDLVLPQPPEVDMGGHGMYGTVGDYLKFVRMLLNRGDSPGGRILKAETVDQMGQNQIGDLLITGFKTADPTLLNDMPLPPDNPHNWGLAFMRNEKTFVTGRSPGSLMWAGICNSYYWIDPTVGVAGVYLTQVLPFADVKSLPLFFGFEGTVYQNL
ncbi:serine hydrolase domain-containing protein [Panacagrimonas sp.]|uniref:serine hydrolase domain-containing protein n=1 Tax=Panacagrimonas sp. TaxID=2480088 RepID=UPI003B517073